MRNRFAEALVRLAGTDERVVLLTGDLGYTVLEPFRDAYPDRFFNVGVAEQNMAGIATGLAEAGYVPFAYSIATFATMRPYEFIRNGAVLHDLPVRIVGVGGGFDYGHNGLTHYALEDIALMRAQPGLAVIAPADADQAETALLATSGLAGPAYFRISKAGAALPGLSGRFELGRLVALGAEAEVDVALIALGPSAHEAVAAADALSAQGIRAGVAVVASVSPAPVDDLVELLGRVELALSIEAHYVNGGVGSLVAEVIAENDLDCRLVRCGVREVPRGQIGTREYLHDVHGLSAQAITQRALRALATGSYS